MSRTSTLGQLTLLSTLADAADITQFGTTFGDLVEKKLVMTFASAVARDATVTVPVAGMVAYIGSGHWTMYDGTVWVTLRDSGTYTPTLGNMAVGTNGGPINSATFTVTNGVLELEGKIKFGTTAPTLPAGATETISLPAGYTLVTTDANSEIAGIVIYNDVSAVAAFKGCTAPVTSSTVQLLVTSVTAGALTNIALTAAIPFAWAVSDEIYYRLTALVVG